MFAAKAPRRDAKSAQFKKKPRTEDTLDHTSSTDKGSIRRGSDLLLERARDDIPEFIGASSIEESSIYSKNEKTLVAYLGPLPREVDQALANADFYTEPLVAKEDLDAGYGIVISQQKCYVWQVQKNATYRTPPLCYAFPMPPNEHTSAGTRVLLPIVTITQSDDNSSGLLACSPSGTCWYWDNIALSVSNVDLHVDAKLHIAAGDYVSHVERVGPMGYYFGTRQAHVHQVVVKRQANTATLATTQLHGKGGGAMASIFSMIGMAQGPDTTQKIVSMTSGPKVQDPHGRWDLFAMTTRSLHKWHVYRSGECTMEADIHLKEQVKEQVLRDYSITLPLGSDPRVRLLDIEYIKHGKLLLLASFFDSVAHHASTPLTYGLFTLSTHFGKTFTIEHAKYIRRAIEEDLRPEASPRIVVPQGGPGVFVVTPSAVIISSTLPNFDFDDIVPLKSDRIIGYGCEDWKQRGFESASASELSIVCKESGRLGIHIQMDGSSLIAAPGKVIEAGPELATNQVQAKLEQAVFFGGKQRNPVSFDLTLYDEGDLNRASLNVNDAILSSRAALLSSPRDMSSGLAERYQRIKGIIDCIQASHMTTLLSNDTRFRLCWSAEKMAAAVAFWGHFQLKLASAQKSKEAKVALKHAVQDAATQTLHKLGANSAEDPVAFFLNYHVNEFADFLANLQKAGDKAPLSPVGLRAELTRDVNKLFVLSLRSAWSYRRQNVESYALQGNSSIEPWTASQRIIASLTAQFDQTLAASKTDAESMEVDGVENKGLISDVNHELKDHLVDLADITLQAHSERLQFLEGLPASSDNNVQIAQAVAAYGDAKTRLLAPLVEIKKVRQATQLAEAYKDFETLVKLCDGQENLFGSYLSKYKQEFADALFQWYIDTNQVPKLLAKGDSHSDLLTSFLDRNDYNEVAWLHDIKIGRFMESSERVQESAFLETNVDRRRTMFSLSKLLFLAGLPQEGMDLEATMKYAGRNNEELEMATIQGLIADGWNKTIGGALVNDKEKAKAVLETFGAPTLGRQKTLREAILKSIESLLSRQAISSEDLLDVLMLQQKREIEGLDVCDVALGICLQAADIPESRRPYVLQDIWRRIFIAETDGYWSLKESGSSDVATSEAEIRERLLESMMCRAFAVIYKADGGKDDLMLNPEQAKGNMPENLFEARFAGSEGGKVEIKELSKAMMRDYELENEELERRMREGELVQKWERVKGLVKEEATMAVASGGQDDVEMEDADL